MKASPAAVTAAAYAIAVALLLPLCCCYCDTLIIWVCFVFRLCRFTIVIPVVLAVAHKIYVLRKTTVLEKYCGLFCEHTYIYFLPDRAFFFFHV